MRMLAVPPHLTGNDVRELWPRFGTRLHYDIEHHMNGHPPKHTLNFPEWKQVLSFMDYLNKRGEKPFRTELTMSIPALRLCGQADFVSIKMIDGRYVLWDWKRTPNIYKRTKKPMLPPWSHRTCTNLNKYEIQLNIYRQMLKTYGIQVDEMYLVIFHKSYPDYKLIRVNPILGQGDSLDAKAMRQMVQDRKRAVDAMMKSSLSM